MSLQAVILENDVIHQAREDVPTLEDACTMVYNIQIYFEKNVLTK